MLEKTQPGRIQMKIVFVGLLLFAQICWARPTKFKTELSFQVATSIPAITVEGQASGLSSQAQVDKGKINLNFSFPVKALQTGMELRDEHMRENIFSDKEGLSPISLEQGEITCSQAELKGDCTFKGKLTLVKTQKAIEIPLKLSQQADGKIAGEGSFKISLKDYAITPPNYMGVTVEDNVDIKFKAVEE